jgi:hypothetical protein
LGRGGWCFAASTQHPLDFGNLGAFPVPLDFEALEDGGKDFGGEFAGFGHMRAL